jgi:hypothetical protein
MDYGYGQTHSLFSNSTTTSSPVFVGDYKRLTLQIFGAGSAFIVQGSNDDGFSAAITNWSTMTTLPAAGIYSITPGPRWLRSDRTGSTASMTLYGAAQ